MFTVLRIRANQPTEPQGHSDEEESQFTDFTKEFDFSDVAFECDDGLVYAVSYVLCKSSPVLDKLLTTKDFKEQDEDVIELPERQARN